MMSYRVYCSIFKSALKGAQIVCERVVELHCISTFRYTFIKSSLTAL